MTSHYLLFAYFNLIVIYFILVFLTLKLMMYAEAYGT